MKKSELQSFIKEQITSTLSEDAGLEKAAKDAQKTAIDKQITSLQSKKHELGENHGEPFNYEWGEGVSIGGTKPSDLTIYYDKESKNVNYSYNNTKGIFSKEEIKNLQDFLNNYNEGLDENINEMARIAVRVMMGDRKKGNKIKEKFKGRWMEKMINTVEAAGKDGISQPALAAEIDKQQQAINQVVKDLIAAGVFKIVGAATPKKETEPKKPEPKNPTPTKKDEEEEEEPKDDNWNKVDDEDKDTDEENIDAQSSTAAKKIDSRAAKLDKVIRDLKSLDGEMKSLANKYKTATGDDKTKVINDLKEKTKLKKELEGLKEKYANELI